MLSKSLHIQDDQQTWRRPCWVPQPLFPAYLQTSRAEDQVEIKMPPAYADIFTSGTGIITTPYVVLEADLEQHNAKILFQLLVNPLTWVLPLPIIQTLQVHRRLQLHHQRLKQSLKTDYSSKGCPTFSISFNIVVTPRPIWAYVKNLIILGPGGVGVPIFLEITYQWMIDLIQKDSWSLDT